MKKSNDLSFSDDDVERLFGMSFGRLKSAQRFNLVSAGKRVSGSNKQLVRCWDTASILKVVLADSFSQHSGLSFNVSALIFGKIPQLTWDIIIEAAKRPHLDIASLPVIHVYDRVEVDLIWDDNIGYTLGTINDVNALHDAFDHQEIDITDGRLGWAGHTSHFTFRLNTAIEDFKADLLLSVA